MRAKKSLAFLESIPASGQAVVESLASQVGSEKVSILKWCLVL